MEYVVIRATRPTWLNTQFPAEAAQLIRFTVGPPADDPTEHRTIAFFARGPGVARVMNAAEGREIVFAEHARQRSLGIARVTDKFLFNIPQSVQRHLGLRTEVRGDGNLRATDDSILWLVPAPEYYEFRAHERREKPWTGPSGGGFSHLYLAKSILPLDRELDELTEQEARIERDEWRPMIEAMQRAARPRRAS